jgi:hypothetical protein
MKVTGRHPPACIVSSGCSTGPTGSQRISCRPGPGPSIRRTAGAIRSGLTRKPFGKSAERLRRADPLYDLILPLDWNWPDAVPGKGSAIFIHQWRRPGYPTAGCLAFSRRDLVFIARHAAPGTRVVVPQRGP